MVGNSRGSKKQSIVTPRSVDDPAIKPIKKVRKPIKRKKSGETKTGKHPGGRPTKYQDTYPVLIVRYFEEQSAAGKLPFLSKFARNIAKVCEDTAIEWTKQYPEFSEAYKKAKDIQKEYLIENGLSGKFNPTAFIFTAKNITDMKDKSEVAVVGVEEVLASIMQKRGANGS